MMKLLTTKSGE